MFSNGRMDFVWAKIVTAHDATASPSKGSFSKTRRLGTSRPASRKTGSVAASARNLFSGQ